MKPGMGSVCCVQRENTCKLQSPMATGIMRSVVNEMGDAHFAPVEPTWLTRTVPVTISLHFRKASTAFLCSSVVLYTI